MKRAAGLRTKSPVLLALSLIVSPSIFEATLSSSPARKLQQRKSSIATKKPNPERPPAFGPTLDKAKQDIPGILDRIYRALDQGNPQAVRALLSAEVANNAEKLDAICQPFTYRGHYIESIIERPHHWFEARVRVLLKPTDEHAYVLLFGVSQGRLFLNDIIDPPSEWFAPQESAAIELARNFIYAAKAGRRDVMPELVSRGLDTSLLFTEHYKSEFEGIQSIEVENVSMKPYKGLKAEVQGVSRKMICFSNWTLLVDSVRGQYKIVKWHYEPVFGCNPDAFPEAPEDPDLEENTLKRFGLAEDNSPSKSTSVSDLVTSPRAKESTPQPITESVATPTSTAQSTEEIKAELTAIENRFLEAERTGDKATFESILADTFAITRDGNSYNVTKAEYLSRVKAQKNMKRFFLLNLNLSFEGPVAVLSGLRVITLRQWGVDLMPAREQFTDKFVRRDGRWQLIARSWAELKR